VHFDRGKSSPVERPPTVEAANSGGDEMNFTQAKAIHELFEELRQEVEQRLPQTIDLGQKTWNDKPITYSLSKVDFEDMEVTYSRYVGCGEYETHIERLNLEELF